MTVAEARSWLARELREIGVDSPDAEAWQLLEAATGLGRSEQQLERGRQLLPAERRRLLGWLARRRRREPLQHILERTWFFGLELVVGPAVLVPRPETEQLVALCLEALRGQQAPRVLDIGTGSGAIALAIKKERPDARLVAVDISRRALAVARANAVRLGLEVTFLRSDLLERSEVAAFAAAADLLVANLPYLPASDRRNLAPEVLRDPPEALFAGPQGLDLFRRLVAQARPLLRPGSVLLLELDPRNVELACCEARDWTRSETFPDLGGRDRFLRLVR